MTTGKRLCQAVALAWILFTVAACVAPMPAPVPPTQAPPASPTTAASPDLLGLVKAYEDAYNRHDLDALVAMFVENGSYMDTWDGSCVGKTAKSGIYDLRGCYSFAMWSQLRLSDCQAQESQVTCQAVVEDKLYAFAGMDQRHFPKYVFTFDDSKIKVVETHLDSKESQKAEAFSYAIWSWAPGDHSDELKSLTDASGNFARTAEVAETWRKLVEEYAAAQK